MNKLPLLTICTVNYNTAHFIKLMLLSLSKLTFNSWQIYICDNGSQNKDLNLLKKVISKYSNAFLFHRNQGDEQPSVAHGNAMDLLVSKVNTEYFITMDSDCIFLKKHWDQILLQNMKQKDLACIGTPAVQNPTKRTDFPNMFAVMFDTIKFQNVNSPSFCPSEDWIKNKEKYKDAEDTGFQIRRNFIQNKYNFEIFKCINTRNLPSNIYKNILCAEYFLKDGTELIACHFSRGSSKGLSKIMLNAPKSFRIPVIGKLLINIKIYYDRFKWINISRKIINNQII